MSHPIFDGLVAGLAVGVGANLVSRAMQPGQTPVWTTTAPDGTVFTIVVTRFNRYEFYAIMYPHGQTIQLGVYPNWIALQAGLQAWTAYLNRPQGHKSASMAISEWLVHNVFQQMPPDQRQNAIAKGIARMRAMENES